VLLAVDLWLPSRSSVIVSVLPNDVGRSIAGPFARCETADQINERLGTNAAAPVQYVRLLKNTVTFDFGDSFQQSKPVTSVIGRRSSGRRSWPSWR
jgi:peptide/nickel transport system permease protein